MRIVLYVVKHQIINLSFKKKKQQQPMSHPASGIVLCFFRVLHLIILVKTFPRCLKLLLRIQRSQARNSWLSRTPGESQPGPSVSSPWSTETTWDLYCHPRWPACRYMHILSQKHGNTVDILNGQFYFNWQMTPLKFLFAFPGCHHPMWHHCLPARAGKGGPDGPVL